MPRRFVPNEIRVLGPVAVVKLTQGKFAVVDVADLDLIEPARWHASQVSPDAWYADSTVPERFMHRIVTGAPKGMYVDHKNHDGLDNRRVNLSVGTQQANIANRNRANTNSRSGVRGVSRATITGRDYFVFRCQIRTCPVVRYFAADDEGQAAAIGASVEHHGA